MLPRISLLFICAVNLVTSHVSINPVRNYDFLTITDIQRELTSLKISFIAFNSTFYFELERNEQLLSLNSKVTVHNTNPITGEQSTTVTDIIAHPYRGKVVIKPNNIRKNKEFAKNLFFDDDESFYQTGQEVGYARIMFHDDPFDPSIKPQDLIFDGVFTHKHPYSPSHTKPVQHHISTIPNYHVSKRKNIDIDIPPPSSRKEVHQSANMIVFKDHSDPEMEKIINEFAPKFKHDSLFESQCIADEEEIVGSCGVVPTKHNSDATKRLMSQFGIDTKRLQKRQAASCFLPAKKVLPMAAAADCAYTTAYGSTSAALTKILSNWNSASAVYEKTFNIALALIEVKIMNNCGNSPDNKEILKWNQGCTTDYTITQRLSDFSEWRGSLNPDQNGLWHLMTKCSTGPSVGIAWLNQLCAKTAFQQNSDGGSQWVSGTAVSSIVPVEWKVVAHEIGHNFGAIHDCISVQCPVSGSGGVCCPCGDACDCGGQFLMHPTDNSVQDAFSPCSIKNMCSDIQTLGAKCIVDPGNLKTITTGICGNGVKEGDEECDCGGSCDGDTCCDGKTCKFIPPAVCDERNDECCQSCSLKSNGTLCRQSTDVCSLSTFCDGKNSGCATMQTLPDGSDCVISTASNTKCASGICTSRDLQCQSLASAGSYRTVKQCSGQENQCQLMCETSGGTCLSLNGFFIDGTSCGVGGFCKNGNCEGANLWLTILNYFNTQPQIAYPLAIVIGLVFLSIVYCIIESCCCRNRPKRWIRRPRNPPPRSVDPVGYNSAPVLPPQPAASNRNSNWVDPTAYNGTGFTDVYIPPDTTTPVPPSLNVPHPGNERISNGSFNRPLNIPYNEEHSVFHASRADEPPMGTGMVPPGNQDNRK